MNQRRKILKNSALLAGMILVRPRIISGMSHRSSDHLRVGLVGCGGRGTGAAAQALMADEDVILTAMGDLFPGQIERSLDALMEVDEIPPRIRVEERHRFTGFDAYQKVIRACDVVILATPPAFRPEHFEFAVEEGKHIFMEKPLSCDSPGTRRILKAGEKAADKNLKVVVGLQNRYDPVYQEMVKRLQEGAIGKITTAVCYYMKGGYQIVPRNQVENELEYQIRNWHFFDWMWSGAPGGLQIHNADIVHWVKNDFPVSVQGIGGRITKGSKTTGDSYDHFFLEYTYEDNTRLYSEIRTIDRTHYKGGVWFTGTKGTANVTEGIKDHDGHVIWKPKKDPAINPYQIELDRFFEAVRKDVSLNDTQIGAYSSQTANMGRVAAQSGNVVTREEFLKSDLRLAPEIVSWDQTPPLQPDENGHYPVIYQGM